MCQKCNMCDSLPYIPSALTKATFISNTVEKAISNMYNIYNSICTKSTIYTSQSSAFHPDPALGAQTNSRHDVDLKRRIRYHPAPLEQFAHKDATLHLGEGVADAGPGAIAKRHIPTPCGGAVAGAAACEPLGVKHRGIRPDTGVPGSKQSAK